jgi:hypothetical protein
MNSILVELRYSTLPSGNLGSKSITATPSYLLENLNSYITSFNDVLNVREIHGEPSTVVGGSAPQDGMFRVRFPRGSLEIFK